MALGKRKDTGNFLPIIKFDARVGHFYLQDRVHTTDGWQNQQRDVTSEFRAAFDLENLQRGWLLFPKGAAPQTVLVPAGEDPGDPPTDDHKEGFRCLLLMAKKLGGDIRELMSTARGLWDAIDRLHDQYLVVADKHPGEVPVVTLDGVREEKRGAGTTFVPTFTIVGWAPRPPELAGAVQARPIDPQPALSLSRPKVKAKVPVAHDDWDDEIPTFGLKAADR